MDRPAPHGRSLVERLLKAGRGLSVWNRTASKAQPLAKYGATIMARKPDLAPIRQLLQAAYEGRRPAG
jgi:3-hydroxyisobutyrate dehydrogenase